jgi:hypothetical protein
MTADNFLYSDIFLAGRYFNFEPVGLALWLIGHKISVINPDE